MLENLYYYGRMHGYWANWTQFCNIPQSSFDQVSDIMFKETYGMSLAEYKQTNIAMIEEIEV